MAWRSGNFFKQNWLSGAACTTPNKGNANRRSRKLRTEKSLKSKPAVCLTPQRPTIGRFWTLAGLSPARARHKHAVPECTHHYRGEACTPHTQEKQALVSENWAQVLASIRCLCTVSVSHGSQHSSAREAGFPAVRGSFFSPPSCLQQQQPPPAPPRHRVLAVVPRGRAPSAVHSREEPHPLGPDLSFPFSSLGLTYPQPRSHSRWLLGEGHCA